jgi:hypothetical protein
MPRQPKRQADPMRSSGQVVLLRLHNRQLAELYQNWGIETGRPSPASTASMFSLPPDLAKGTETNFSRDCPCFRLMRSSAGPLRSLSLHWLCVLPLHHIAEPRNPEKTRKRPGPIGLWALGLQCRIKPRHPSTVLNSSDQGSSGFETQSAIAAA